MLRNKIFRLGLAVLVGLSGAALRAQTAPDTTAPHAAPAARPASEKNPARHAAARNLPHHALDHTGQFLTEWLLVGPYTAQAGEQATDVDFLGEAIFQPGASEESLLAEIQARAGATGAKSTRASGEELVDFIETFDLAGRRGPQTAVYALCGITSETERTAWLMLGTDDEAKVWLNGEVLLTARGARYLTPNENAMAVTLQPGTNLLVVKVANLSGGWQLRVRLEENIASARAFTLASIKVTQKKVLNGGPFAFRIPGPPLAAPMAVTLTNQAGVVVETLQVQQQDAIRFDAHPAGLYLVTLNPGPAGCRYAEIYTGSMAELHRATAARCAQARVDDRIRMQLDTLMRRFDLVVEANQPTADGRPRSPAWVVENEYKAVYTAMEINAILAALQAGEEPLSHRPGLHLRAFRSRVDDQVMHYRISVPASYDPHGPGLALVVIPTPVAVANRPYLESTFVAEQRAVEYMGGIADSMNLGLLWTGYRALPYGNPTDFAHLDEVLATVAADYKLDPDRLTLWGTSSAGMLSLMEALRKPGTYAGIALSRPLLHRKMHRYGEGFDFGALPAYQAYLSANDPFEAATRMKTPPLLIHNDASLATDPHHARLRPDAENFVVLARANGVRPAPRLITTRFPYPNLLQWLAEKKKSATASAAVSGPATLASVFAERFVVVEATGGSEQVAAANAALSKQFQEAWQQTNHVPCRVIRDVDLTTDEEIRSNLVLLGNAESNAVWKRLAAKLPLELGDHHVRIRERRWEGEELAVQAWFAHPEQPERKLVVIGGAAPATFGTLDLSLDGWFDYAVWAGGNGSARLIDAGAYQGP